MWGRRRRRRPPPPTNGHAARKALDESRARLAEAIRHSRQEVEPLARQIRRALGER